jgi:hypothetical protein
VLLDVLRVDERDDAVEAANFLHLVVHEEGLRDGRRVGHAGRLDEMPSSFSVPAATRRRAS